ncbi:MAG: histidine--tRNA ligase [Candidatus Bathyarchaeia archaeon]
MRHEMLQPVRGMRDLTPNEAWKLRLIESNARRLAELYGYEEIITPVIEHYDLLAAKIGEENRKRMYIFEDLGGRKVALRPEFTASIARVVATKLLTAPKPIRLFSFGSLYRYDEPQLGRYREFWQANYELIGSSRSEADAEILCLTNDFLNSISLRDYTTKINHIGILRWILSREGVSEDGQNVVMQALDKKDWDGVIKLAKNLGVSERCVDVLKSLIEIRCYEKSKFFEEVGETVKGYEEAASVLENLRETIDLLDRAGIKMRFYFEAGFARGLEYYTGIIFETYVPELDIAICGGGRYDKLIKSFGGGMVPAIGVAFGVDRIMLAMERQGVSPSRPRNVRVLVVSLDDGLLAEAIKIANMLRMNKVPSEVEVMGRSLSRALSDASRREITHVVIIGPKEISEGKVVLRDMKSKSQREVRVENLPAELSLELPSCSR